MWLPSLLASQNGRCSCQSSIQQRFASSNEAADPPLPEIADVVIIGGGSIGCSTLYHLARMGAGNGAVLLERGKLTCGTTWHTAGLVWRLRPSDVEIQLLDSTRNLLRRLEDETGLNSGWIQNGGLFIANTEERLKEYRRLMTAGRSFDIESRMISPDEAKELFPLLDPKAFSGALYSPGDGTVDPNSLCTALTKYATSRGGKVYEGCPVTNVILEGKKFGVKQVSGVNTPKGFIQTKKIINCSGVWGREIAKMAGVEIPLVPMKHAYVVTESIPGVRNTPNVRDHDSSTYFRVQGDSLCVGGYEFDPILLDDVWILFSPGLKEELTVCGDSLRWIVGQTAGWENYEVGPQGQATLRPDLIGFPSGRRSASRHRYTCQFFLQSRTEQCRP